MECLARQCGRWWRSPADLYALIDSFALHEDFPRSMTC